MKKIKNIKNYFLINISKSVFAFFAILFLSLSMSTLVLGNGPTTGSTATGPTTNTNPGVNIDAKIKNPIKVDTIEDFIKELVNIVLVVGVPLLVLAIIYAGFLFVQAQGNTEKLKTAKKTLLYTIIGGFLLLGAFVIANAIGGTVNEIKRGS